MWAELLGGAASAIGSLFGKKEQKTKIDLKGLVKEAVSNGFNPLTVLRNGGAAGFTTTTQPTLGLAESLSSIGGALGGALDKKFDPMERKRNEAETALLDYQIRSVRQGPQRPGAVGQNQVISTGTKVQAVKPSLGKALVSAGSSYGPQLPPGAGKDGEILPAIVAWKRSDGTLMYTYNPEFPDGDAQVAGAAADAFGRFREGGESVVYREPTLGRTATRAGRYSRPFVGPVKPKAAAGQGRWGRYDRH